MAGLVPTIHETTKLCNLLGRSLKATTELGILKLGALAAAGVVGRDKPGHDDKVGLSGQISHPDS